MTIHAVPSPWLLWSALADGTVMVITRNTITDRKGNNSLMVDVEDVEEGRAGAKLWNNNSVEPCLYQQWIGQEENVPPVMGDSTVGIEKVLEHKLVAN